MFPALHLHRDPLIAVIALEDGGVSVALMYGHSGRVIAHEHVRELRVPESRGTEGAATAARIREAGSKVLDAYAKTGFREPVTSAYCFVHAPYAHTVVRRAGETFRDELQIDVTVIKELFKNACDQATGIDATNLLEAGVLKVDLNGYTTARPIGQYAHSAEVTAIMSDVDAEMKKAATSAIQTLFPVAYISWRSGIRSVLGVERVLDRLHEYIVAFVGTGHTSMYTIDSGSILSDASTEEAMRSILERAGGARNPQETAAYFRMIGRDACEDDACAAILGALGQAEPDLVRVFGEIFSALSREKRLPNEMLLIADENFATWLSRFFARIDFSQFTATTLPFAVQSATPKRVSDIITCPESIEPMLAIACAYVRTELRR